MTKLVIALLIGILFLGSAQGVTDKILSPPASGLECHESYALAIEPRLNAILDATRVICNRKGGFQVFSHLFGAVNHPHGVIVSCIGDRHSKVIFACYYYF